MTRKKLRNFLAMLLVSSLFISNIEPIDVSASGSDGKTMNTDELVFITLADNTDYRWNANGNGDQGNVIHLDTVKGSNCKFKLKKVVDKENNVSDDDANYYGIKFIRDAGTDRFADIEDKSKDDGKKLHLWESDDKEVKGNEHRQFAFYLDHTDSNGNECYYIKNRNSGLWLGVEDTNENGKNDKGDKIIQTSEEGRKLWIITKAVVPKCGNEAEDIIAEGQNSAFVEIFQKDTIHAINRVNDKACKGTALHLYDVGTSSKWRIDWNSTYSAYTIHAVTGGEKDRGSLFTDGGVVWDVKGEDGKTVHLWDEQSKSENQNTSQFWRFIQQRNGGYKIQNARSGLYLDLTGEEPNQYLVLSEEGEDFDISAFADQKDPINEVNFDYATNWMKDIPNDVSLSSVNIPGTHDTGTASVWEDDWAQFSWTSCQKLYYGEQLNVGVRSFDIRCNAKKDDASPSDVMIVHGGETSQCGNRDDTDLTLEDIFDDSVRFLKKHSSESIVMMVKSDAGSTTGLVHAVSEFIKDNKNYVYTGGGIPSMGEARGKIVFIRRYKIEKTKYDPAADGVNADWLGIDLSDWDTHDYSDYKYAIEIYNEDNVSVYVQDAYKEAAADKCEYIEGTMKQTVGENSSAPEIPSDAWIYNYTSTTGGFGIATPLSQTLGINPWLYDDEIGCIDNRRLGMVMLNFVDAPMARLIYETNFKEGKFFASKATPPTYVTLTCGKTLSEAKFSGQSGYGSWTFDDADYIPTWEDYKAGRSYSMTFTPSTFNRQSVTAKVAIDSFVPRDVEVTIDNKEITYGEATPTLTYSYTCVSQLLEGDTKDDLNITLEIDPKAEGKDGRLKAGTWKITGTADNENYSFNFNAGQVTVKPKTLGVTWSDTTNLRYDGNAKNVTAQITGVMDGDDCTAVVTGGNEVGPSWPENNMGEEPTKYTAKVSLSGDDAANYELAESDKSKSYYILKEQPGEDEYKFPEKAKLTYGQTLGDAILEGASGDGKFVFVDKDNKEEISNEKPDAGTYDDQYYLAFIPSDKDEGMVVNQTPTTVEVLKKDVKIKVKDAEITHADLCYNPFAGYDYDLVDGYSLVDDDTKENLGVKLTSTGKEQSNVGTYPITLDSCTNTNYNVTAIPGTLTVNPFNVTVKWQNLAVEEKTYITPGGCIYYTGNQVNIGPVFETTDADATKNLDSGDYEVIGTQGKDVGKYKLRVFFTNKNYKVSGNSDSYGILEYEIIKATPDNVTFPTEVSITYGQTLSQAEFTGGDKKGYSGKFVVEDAASDETLRTVADSGNDVTVQFIPDDTRNYEVLDADVPLQVNPKKLTVKADNQKLTYGEDTSELTLTWSMDESQLVGDDSKEDFAFTLKVGTEENTILDAGHHPISIELDSGKSISATTNNYDIDCQEGYLEISPRVAKIQWSDTTCIIKDGAEPSVSITNLVSGDDCQVVVESDGTATLSYDANTRTWTPYTAKITGLSGADRFNYSLSVDDDDLKISYYVLDDENDCVMPEEAYLTYGQKRSEVKWSTMAGKGTFLIVDRQTHKRVDDDTILSAGEYNDYAVMFAPDGLMYEDDCVYSDITLYVEKKELTVNALSVEKTYGEETKLDFEVDASKLVGEDTKADLGVVLTAIGTSESEEENIDGNRINSPVGTYDITMAQCNSANYDVTVVSSMLTIHPKEVTLSWSDVSNLVYSGKPVNVTAKAEGILEGDTCEVKVFNGQRIEAGTYRAIAVSLSNTNYTLPKLSESNLSKFVKEYTIKAIPNIDGLPTVAERVYNPNAALKDEDLIAGNVLDIKGESLAGTWSWKEQNIVPTVGNQGYEAVFTPSDEDLEYQYITITETIAVPMKKATPYISSGPVASAITYGQSLDASKLSGGTVVYGNGKGQAASAENGEDAGNIPVAGTFAWKDATVKPTVADSEKTTYTVVFTPEDSDNYETVEMDITLTVNKADNAPNIPENTMDVPYSTEKVSDVILPDGWVWQDTDKTKALTVGEAVIATAIYIGANRGNYATESVEIAITRQVCDHVWDAGKVTKKATEKAEGEKTYTCTICGETKTEVIPKKPAAPKKGDIVRDDKGVAKVEVTDVAKKEVTYKAIMDTKVKTVTIPDTVKVDGTTYKVTSVAANAFSGNKKITKVTMGSNIKTVGEKAFYKCTSLTKINIPSRVKKIDKQAFYGCKSLKSITIKTTKLNDKNVGSNVFKGIYSKATIKVPKSKLNSYKKILRAKGVSSKAEIK